MVHSTCFSKVRDFQSLKSFHCDHVNDFPVINGTPGIIHCYRVNDFPVVNGTPGIIQDPSDLLLVKLHFSNKRSLVLVFSTCNTHALLLIIAL